MDAWFIIFIIFGAITLLTFSLVPLVPKEGEYRDSASPRGVVFKLAVALTFVSLALLFVASFTTIPTKTVGIETQFGRPGAVLNNGWHWKNPAAVVHKFDASLQSDRYSSDQNDDGDPITVRLFTGSQAKVNTTFQWKLEDNANFVQVFMNYREPEKIRDNLVKRALQQALNEVFASYNPYAALIAAQDAAAKPGTTQVSTSFEDFQRNAMTKLRTALGPQGVEAASLTISSIEFDGKTQANLDGLSSSIAQTQIAIQNEKTADAVAAANAKLNATPATAATIQQLCIQATQKVLEEGHQLPAGWSCSGSTSTVIPAK